MTAWTQAAVDKANSGKDTGSPRASKPPAPPMPPPPEQEAVQGSNQAQTLEPWLLNYRVAAYHYDDAHRRVVFTGIPTGHVNAFLLHCQQFKP